MSTRTIGIIMNGVTGRMGRNQHLVRSILAIREQGGVDLGNGEKLLPEPILVGRSETKLQELARQTGLEKWTTSLDEALRDFSTQIYFDAQITSTRVPAIKAAIAAGKHIYCEKPTAETLDDALELVRLAAQAGVKNGVVQDKLFLPGLRKLKRVIDSGFLGRILSVRGEFGYWVFEGDWQAAQRPSWNYRKEEGGGIIVDMLPHWRYVMDNLFGEVKALSCLGTTHIPTRWDEAGEAYEASADDAVYATFKLEGEIIAQVNSSWTTRVYRDELVAFQVDGTEGSAVAGLRDCRVQHRTGTPKPVWNPDVANPFDFRSDWNPIPDNQEFDNGFKAQWELFLQHVIQDAPFPFTLMEGAKGVQLAELGIESWRQGCWLEVPELRV